MASAMNVTVIVPETSTLAEADRFWVESHGEDLQVRLDGPDSVYVCYTSGFRREIIATNVAWGVFEKAFKEMVDRLVS